MPEGLGFAIPVNLVRGVMDQLIAHGRVIRGYLGVDTTDLPESQAKSSASMARPCCWKASAGPALAAGLKPGDVLTHVNGQRMFTRQQAMNFVASSQPGQRIEIRVVRPGGVAFETTAVLVERPPQNGN